ncbi:hypothetical protein [Rufibacter roseus]
MSVFGQESPYGKHVKIDERGNIIERVAFMPKGEIAIRYFSKYDSLNRLVETFQTQANSIEKEWINTFEYNDKNQLIRRNWYPTEKMILYGYETYKYGAHGKKIELLKYNSDGLLFKESWKYDKDGTLRVYKKKYFQYGGPEELTSLK